MPYSHGLLLDNSNNYGIVKTETVFGFGPTNSNLINTNNSTKPLEWILESENYEKSMDVTTESSRSLQNIFNSKVSNAIQPRHKKKKKKMKKEKKKEKKKLKRKGKVKKCIFKVIKGKKEKKNRGGKYKMHKKYMMPMILGLLAAKMVLIPIAMKALAFLSTKGLMMGFFSTVMASILSLKGMWEHSHYRYQDRKDDTKTQVEIIQVPSKSDDHIYYDDHYKRKDYIPFQKKKK